MTAHFTSLFFFLLVDRDKIKVREQSEGRRDERNGQLGKALTPSN